MGGQPGGYGAPPQGRRAGWSVRRHAGRRRADVGAGQFGGGMAPGGFGGGGGGAGGGGAGARGETRNPTTTLILSLVCCFYFLYAMWTMLNELQAYTRDDEFKPWYMFIPLLNYYFLWIKVPEQVAKAKQMAGSRNAQARGIVWYIFLAPFALSQDLNEVWDPSSGG
ncbi:MAG: hypothetical protein WKG00_36920 [Polyangiaceae bacterium]